MLWLYLMVQYNVARRRHQLLAFQQCRWIHHTVSQKSLRTPLPILSHVAFCCPWDHASLCRMITDCSACHKMGLFGHDLWCEHNDFFKCVLECDAVTEKSTCDCCSKEMSWSSLGGGLTIPPSCPSRCPVCCRYRTISCSVTIVSATTMSY